MVYFAENLIITLCEPSAVAVLYIYIFKTGCLLLFHVIEHPQIVPMLLEPALYLMEQISQLHANDKAGHGQEYIAPHQHVQMVDEVYDESG